MNAEHKTTNDNQQPTAQNTPEDVGRMLAESVAEHLQARFPHMTDNELRELASEYKRQASGARAQIRRIEIGESETDKSREKRARLLDDLRQEAKRNDDAAQTIIDGIEARTAIAARAQEEQARINGHTLSRITVDAQTAARAVQHVGKHCISSTSCVAAGMVIVRANCNLTVDAPIQKDNTPTHAEIAPAEPPPIGNDAQAGAVVYPTVLARALKAFDGPVTLRIYDIDTPTGRKNKAAPARMLDIYAAGRRRIVTLRPLHERDFPTTPQDAREEYTVHAMAGYTPIPGAALVWVDAPPNWQGVYGALPANYRQVTGNENDKDGQPTKITQMQKRVKGIYYFKAGRRALFLESATNKNAISGLFDAQTGTRLYRRFGKLCQESAKHILENMAAKVSDKDVDAFLRALAVDPETRDNGKELERACTALKTTEATPPDGTDTTGKQNDAGQLPNAQPTEHTQQEAASVIDPQAAAPVTVDTFGGELFAPEDGRGQAQADAEQDGRAAENAADALQQVVRRQNANALKGRKWHTRRYRVDRPADTLEGAWHKVYEGNHGRVVFNWHGKWWTAQEDKMRELAGPFGTAAAALAAC